MHRSNAMGAPGPEVAKLTGGETPIQALVAWWPESTFGSGSRGLASRPLGKPVERFDQGVCGVREAGDHVEMVGVGHRDRAAVQSGTAPMRDERAGLPVIFG